MEDQLQDRAELLMTTGNAAHCPDCQGARLFVEVADGEHCCTDCGAAYFLLDTGWVSPRRPRLSRSA